jgi:hypothetical protein
MLIDIVSSYLHAELLEHFLHFVQDVKRRVIQQPPAAIINVNVHFNLSPYKTDNHS